MPAFRRSIRALILVTGFSLPVSPAFSQADPYSAKIPQPHLAKARAIAFGENGWKFPALITCYPDEGQSAEHVIKDPGPSKAADNLFFLGTGIVAAWAVNTSDGIILIDTLNNQADAEKYIEGGLRQLGLDPAHIKTIIVSHGHGDHYGGARYLQDKYHAKLYMTALDYDLAEKPTAPEKHFGPAPHRDQVASDGQTITLGDESIKLFITAGHTPASLSMLIPVKDKGQSHTLLYLGGITNKGLKPEMHTAYDKWTDRLLKDAASADGVIGNHSSYDEAATKLDKIKIMPNRPNPFFTGAANTVRYLKVLKECNLNNWEIEKALKPKS
jgi:metallo-beta-lactamase class B